MTTMEDLDSEAKDIMQLRDQLSEVEWGGDVDSLSYVRLVSLFKKLYNADRMLIDILGQMIAEEEAADNA